MRNLLIRLIINAVAIYVTVLLVPGIRFAGEGVDIGALLVVALFFGLVNAIIKPVVKLFTFPFYLFTLGLFTFVVNALMLMLTAYLSNTLGNSNFIVEGFGSALLGGIIISIISMLLSVFVSDE